MTTGAPQEASHRAAADPAARRAALAVLVEATTEELDRLVSNMGPLPPHEIVRAPETGLVMVQGRIGGDGRPFHVGEGTVPRAVIRLAGGEMGFGYALGRDQAKARLVALCDALLQSPAHGPATEDRVLAPLRARIAEERARVAAHTAATRVDFFTLVRGDN